MSSKPIVFLAFANELPSSEIRLRNLPLEQSAITNIFFELQKAGWCELIVRSYASIDEIINVFQTYKTRINIFHYGGHSNSWQLLLNSEDKTDVKPAHSEGLISFLTNYDHLKLIFLNGCSTKNQALDLAKILNCCVIGTNGSISDEVARLISVSFYKGLANQLSIIQAWKDTLSHVKLKFGTANVRDLMYENINDNVRDISELWEIVVSDKEVLNWKFNNQEINYNIKNIHKLLMNAYNDESLSVLCMLHFEYIYNNFAFGQTKQQKIMMLIDHCKRFVKFETLLQLVEQENQIQYNRYKPYF